MRLSYLRGTRAKVLYKSRDEVEWAFMELKIKVVCCDYAVSLCQSVAEVGAVCLPQ